MVISLNKHTNINYYPNLMEKQQQHIVLLKYICSAQALWLPAHPSYSKLRYNITVRYIHVNYNTVYNTVYNSTLNVSHGVDKYLLKHIIWRLCYIPVESSSRKVRFFEAVYYVISVFISKFMTSMYNYWSLSSWEKVFTYTTAEERNARWKTCIPGLLNSSTYKMTRCPIKLFFFCVQRWISLI